MKQLNTYLIDFTTNWNTVERLSVKATCPMNALRNSIKRYGGIISPNSGDLYSERTCITYSYPELNWLCVAVVLDR